MGALAICPRTRSHARVATEAVAVRPVEVPAPRPAEVPAESPLTHESAAEALVLAFSPLKQDAASRRVVAYVLEDGTVVAGGRAHRDGRSWSNGRVSGRDWTLWWQRRALGDAR